MTLSIAILSDSPLTDAVTKTAAKHRRIPGMLSGSLAGGNFFSPLQAAKVDSLAAIDWLRLQFPHQFHNTQKASIYIIVCSAGQQLPGNLKLFWFQLTRTAAIELAGIAIDKLMICAFYFFDQWVTAGATVTSVSKETVQANISHFSSYMIYIYIYILYRERHSHHSFFKCTCKQNVCLCF